MQGSFNIRNKPSAMLTQADTDGLYVIAGAGIEAITADKNRFYQKLWLYPAKAVVAGVLTANAANIRLGKSGANNAALTVTGITRRGPTAIAACVAHGYYPGQNVTIASATPTDFNGTFEITAATADTFEFIPLTVPAKDGTGAITATVTAYLPETLAPTDGPILLEAPLGQRRPLCLVIIKGTATDGVFYTYS